MDVTSDQSGSEYLQAFAKYLKEEYMSKSVSEIFMMVDKLMEVRKRNSQMTKGRTTIKYWYCVTNDQRILYIL